MKTEVMKMTFLAVAALAAQVGAMERVPLDGMWDFAFQEGGRLAAAAADFKATDKVVVPGCFDLMPKWYAKRGLAHYRRTFELKADVTRAYLVVKGMGLQGRFFVDGREVGASKLPFSTFELDCGALKSGPHTLVAALDNNLEWNPALVFQPNYDFFLSGGFYHGVELKLQTRPVELDRVVVRTRDYRTGLVELALEAKGALPDPVEVQVSFDGAKAQAVVFRKGRARLNVPGFRLWSPERPNLHTVRVAAADFGESATRFGIRTFETKGKRFLLNGEDVYLKGVNRHDSHPEDGYATTRTVMFRDIELMKSIGCNYVRGSHYPQTDEFLSLCDEMGLMVWEESLAWGNGRELKDPEFIASQVEQTRLMVRNSINHPSVVISAFLNEFGSERPEGKSLCEKLVATIKAEDSGHLVTFASSHPYNGISEGACDFIAFNMYPAWHSEIGRGTTPETLQAALKKRLEDDIAYLRGKFGHDKPLIIGETGVYSIYGHHDPMGAQWTEEFQREYLETQIKNVYASREMSGFTVWQFCDARTFFRGGSDIRTKPFGYNNAGLFDRHRNPKLAARMIGEYYRRTPPSRIEPPKVILDTDMITDFDDVGALACLHALADAGECEILATVSCTRGNASTAAIGVINGYYGRADLPVGCAKEIGVLGAYAGAKEKVDPASPLGEKGPGDGGHYKYRKLALDYPQWVKYLDSDDAPDANVVYRKALAAAPDKSVVICSIGFLTNLRRLLETQPDDISPLNGRDLVAKKVRKWVAMACRYPKGKEYNSMWDPESSRIAIENWPTPIVFSDWQYGVDVFAGRAIAEMEGPRNPVKDVFAGNVPSREEVRKDPAKYQGWCFGMGGRSAWDETAVLAAVRGEGSYFNVHRGTYRMVGTGGENLWIPDEANGPHVRITEKLNKSEVGKIIDELICRKPAAEK